MKKQTKPNKNKHGSTKKRVVVSWGLRGWEDGEMSKGDHCMMMDEKYFLMVSML